MITFPKEILIYMKLEQLLSFVIAIVTVDTREEMGPDKILLNRVQSRIDSDIQTTVSSLPISSLGHLVLL